MGYETDFQWSLHELRKLAVVTTKKVDDKVFIVTVICGSILLLYGLSNILLRKPGLGIFYSFLSIVCCALPQIRNEISMRKFARNRSSAMNTSNHFLFFEDRVELSCVSDNKIFMYDDLIKIIETDTNFYFFADKKSAFSVWKSKCSPELVERIRRKLK